LNAGKWAIVAPVIGMVAVAAIPFVRYAQKERAESAAVKFLEDVRLAQRHFAAAHGERGFAAGFDSLSEACPGAAASFAARDIHRVGDFGYQVILRPASGAITVALDCHGRPLVSDYYAAASPSAIDTAGQQAFALAGAGRIYVFFDGIAPLEKDMAPGGLATPLDTLDAFKIP